MTIKLNQKGADFTFELNISVVAWLTGTHSQWTQYITPKGAPKSGCQVCSNSKVWSPNRHSEKNEEKLQMFF